MSYWDSSALIKLYVQELDSAEFRALAAKASRVATGSLTRHEVRTVFRKYFTQEMASNLVFGSFLVENYSKDGVQRVFRVNFCRRAAGAPNRLSASTSEMLCAS